METVVYIRWSSAEQGKGTSLERQREDCRRHAASKGWTITAEIVDEGVSAFKGRHAAVGGLSRFVALVESGGYPDGVILLTEKLDRLSREPAKKVFAWMLGMTDLGVTIATVDGDRRYDSRSLDMGTIIEVVVKAQLSNEESEKKASRLAGAWAAKRRRLASGERLVLTRRAPAWLSVVGTPPEFAIVPERAAVVRRIFEDTAAGHGKHMIARTLNLEGVPTFGRADGWHASYVQKILRSAAVLGEFQPGRKPRGEARSVAGDLIPDYYPRVVDADVHAAAMRSMAGRQRRIGGRGRRLVNLFAGLATCDACGSRMTFRSKGAKRRADGSVVAEDYLICDGHQRGRGCGNGHHFNYADWEPGVLGPLLLDALQDRHFASPDEIRPLEMELADRIREHQAARRRADTALALYVESERAEIKEMWQGYAREVDGLDATVLDLRRRLVVARGAVSPEEHRRRIFELYDRIQDADERVRFETRSRIMEALHELVDGMRFKANPPMVTVTARDGGMTVVGWEDWGGRRDLGWTKWREAPRP